MIKQAVAKQQETKEIHRTLGLDFVERAILKATRRKPIDDKRAFLKNNWPFVLLTLIISLNILWLIRNEFTRGNPIGGIGQDPDRRHLAEGDSEAIGPGSDLYGMTCPEFSGTTISGETINLRDFIGSIIILRFSRFYREDLPSLVYLQELAEQQEASGVRLILINSLGRHEQDVVDSLVHLSAPIIEDGSKIRAALNAYPEETVIIDCDFRIRFQSEIAGKKTIYDEIDKLIGQSQLKRLNTEEDLAQAIRAISYLTIDKGEKAMISDFKENLIVTFFSGLCTGCGETGRIRLLREFSQRSFSKGSRILLLFGIRNSLGAIREFAHQQGWDELPIVVGLADSSNVRDTGSYYRAFSLDIDPKTCVLTPDGKLLFVETRNNSRELSLDTLARVLR